VCKQATRRIQGSESGFKHFASFFFVPHSEKKKKRKEKKRSGQDKKNILGRLSPEGGELAAEQK